MADPIATPYFLGVDPAPAVGRRADDGALVAGRGVMRDPTAPISSNPSAWWFQFVWAYVLRGARVREWSGFIHAKHRQFNFTGILMDAGAGGGGVQIMQELALSQQLINGVETECVPIVRPEEESVVNGYFILNMFKRGDPGINALWPLLQGDDNLVDGAHVAFAEAVEHAGVMLPRPFHERPREETQDWPQEKQWAARNLGALANQLTRIQVVTNDDGTWALTRHNARQFVATGKKDIAYAAMFAYICFLIWLKTGGQEFQFDLEGDAAAMGSVMR